MESVPPPPPRGKTNENLMRKVNNKNVKIIPEDQPHWSTVIVIPHNNINQESIKQINK
ncbi:unnamed protein product, partial [Trichogramma brassicae]